MLSKNRIEMLFHKLNEKCEASDITGEVGIVGGAVMCLVYNARPSTKDIDGIFVPTQRIREFIAEISDEEGVPRDWLNDGAKGYMGEGFERVDIINLSHLKVWAPQPDYMLAMKCMSARFDSNDGEDVVFLMKHLGLKRIEDVLKTIECYYPKHRVQAKTQFFLEEIIETNFAT